MNKQQQSRENANESGSEAFPHVHIAEIIQITETLGRIEMRQEFQDKQNAERLARLEAALGVRTTAENVTVGAPGFISRTITWTWDNKYKVLATAAVIGLGGYGGVRYYKSK